MIPPFIQQILGTLVRHLVTWLGGMLAARGIVISDDQTIQITAALTTLLAPLLWSVWQKFRGRQKLLLAAASPQVLSEQEVEARVASPHHHTPSVLTPKHEVPR